MIDGTVVCVFVTLCFCVAIAFLLRMLLFSRTRRRSTETFAQDDNTRQQQMMLMAGQQMVRTLEVRRGQLKSIPACEKACKSHQTQAQSVVMYDPTAVVRPATDPLLLCGVRNFNADVYAMTQLRQKVLDAAIDILHRQQDFIIFFTKQNFEGRMFFLSAHENVSWTFDGEEPASEDFSMSKLEEAEKKEQEQETQQEFIDAQSKDEQSSHIDIPSFIDEFSFDMGRKYSCIIPDSVEHVQIIPFDTTKKPSEGWTGLKLSSGKHPKQTYNDARPAVFNIRVKKTDAGWTIKRQKRNQEGEWTWEN